MALVHMPTISLICGSYSYNNYLFVLSTDQSNVSSCSVAGVADFCPITFLQYGILRRNSVFLGYTRCIHSSGHDADYSLRLSSQLPPTHFLYPTVGLLRTAVHLLCGYGVGICARLLHGETATHPHAVRAVAQYYVGRLQRYEPEREAAPL